MSTHEGSGWGLIEVIGPVYGDTAFRVERKIKTWLKMIIGTIPGTTENWATSSLEVGSLRELKARSGIETDLF